MKTACLLVDHLPVKVEMRRDTSLSDKPLILACSTGSSREVYDFSPWLRNIRVGMPLQQALSFHIGVHVLEADILHYQEAFEDLVRALEQRSPVVEPGDIGCIYVGLDGLEEMYGGEARLIQSLIQAVPDHLGPKVGVATGKFVAQVAARKAKPGGAFKAPKDARPFLAPYPVETLPISWKVVSRLRSFGLKTLGQVAKLPMGAIQAQFGLIGRLIWDLSNGRDRSHLVPRKQDETVSQHLSFSDPTSTTGVILLGVETLLGRAFSQQLLRGRYARLASLQGQMYRGPLWVQPVPFREPVGDKARALSAIKAKLDAHPVPGPLEDLYLTLSGLTGEAGQQASLFVDIRRKDQLRETLRQLEVSLGRRPPIYQVREVEPWSRLPERRMALVQYVP